MFSLAAPGRMVTRRTEMVRRRSGNGRGRGRGPGGAPMNRMTAFNQAADLIGSLLAPSRLFVALALIVISLSLPGAASAADDRLDLIHTDDVAVDEGTVIADP